MKFLVKFDLEFDLKFEHSDGKNLVKFWGEDFSTCQESTNIFGANFGANFGPNFGNFVSNFATFFGNFVQQKGGAKKHPTFQELFPIAKFYVCSLFWLELNRQVAEDLQISLVARRAPTP